jgi:hypothetical protein
MEKIDIFPVQIIKSKVAEHQAVKDFLMTHALPEFEKNGVNDKTNNTYTEVLDNEIDSAGAILRRMRG